MKHRSLRYPAALLLIIALAAIAVGIGRYGSADNLRRRVEAELVARLPHPEFVPTPLPFDDTVLVPRARATTQALRLPIETSMPDIGKIERPPGTPSPAMLPAAAPIATGLPVHPVVPTITPSPGPPPTPTPSPVPIATLPSTVVRLSRLTQVWQTWNNCGPATLSMYLSYFGQKVGQEEIRVALRPDPDDKNVNLEEMAGFARSRGLSATVRVNADSQRLRRLIDAGVPVLIETWHEPKPNDGMGHYRLMVGYDDAAGRWIVYDSFDARGLVKGQPYAGIRLSFEEIDRLWTVFDRQYLVIFDAAHAPAVQSILDEDVDEATMWTRALARGQAAVQERPDDPFAWFNLGSDFIALGQFKEATQAYDRARQIGLPWRMLWYQFGPFRAYYETGRYDEVIALANATIATAKQTEELFYWRGLAEQAKGDAAAARASWQRAIELNPHYAEAVAALAAAGKQ